MAKTPKKVTIEVDFDRPEIKRAIMRAETLGYNEGLEAGRREILSWLQRAYVEDEGRPDRGSIEGQAILLLAKNAAEYISKQGKKGHKK